MQDLSDILQQHRQSQFGQIYQTLSNKESLQIISLTGSAKSLLFTQLFPEYLQHQHSIQCQFFVFSCKNLNFAHDLGQLESSLNLEKLNIVIIDDLSNELVPEKYSSLWDNLWNLRSHHKNNLVFLFLTSSILNYTNFGQFGYVLSENIHYLSAPTFSEYSDFINNQFPQVKLAQTKTLFNDTLGNYRLSKIFLKETENLSLSTLTKSPWLSSRCCLFFDKLIQDLSFYSKSLQFLAVDQPKLVPESDLLILQKLGLVSSNGLLLPILANYLKHTSVTPYVENLNGFVFVTPLTENEIKLFQALSDSSNQVISRDDLIKKIWSPEKYLEIYDHSLDQLVYRLKQKVKLSKLRLQIKAQKGRGFVLIV